MNIAVDQIDQLKWSQIFSQVEYIALQNTEVPIGVVGDIKMASDKIFVSCSKPKALYIFDIEGKFLASMNRIGKGPGEVISINSFDVNPQNQTIYVVNRSLAKVVLYDFEGEFRNKEFKLFGYPQAITCMEDGYFGIFGGNDVTSEYRFIVYDSSANIVDKFLALENNHKRKYLNFLNRSNFFSNENYQLGFFNHDDGRIYAFENGIWSLHKRIDFGEKQIPQDFYSTNFQDVREFSQTLEKLDYAYNITSYLETDKHILFGFTYQGKYVLCIYNKENSNYTLTNEWINDMGLGSLMYANYEFVKSAPINAYKNKVFGYYSADEIFAIRDSLTISEELATIAENDNPVVWIGVLK